MHVLLVDQDSASVEALSDALREQRSQWQVQGVHSGEQALAALGERHFDAIVTDMGLAPMDAAQLLARVRELHPQVVRLCLSGPVDEAAFLRAVPVAHQFLRKPCDADTVCEVIERACSLRAILQHQAIRALIGKLEMLPAAPETFQALTAAIAEPTAHSADISQIVSKDTALCVKTLQIVNCALFRRSGPITSIQAAVTFVGLEMLKALALSACVFNTLDASPLTSKLLSDLQLRSIRKGRFAHMLLDGSGGADEAFTAALLLDIGQVVLALSSPEQFARMMTVARERDRPWHEVEPEFFGVAHPEVGACLLGLWGLPLDLIELVAYHHTPSRVQHGHTRVLAAVHVADAVIDATSDLSIKLFDRLDGAFIQRTDIARYLKGWNINSDADARALQLARAS